MKRKTRSKIDRLSTGLLAAALVTNYASHRAGHGTICSTMRPVFRTNTRTGKVVAVAAWASLTAWFIPHFVNGEFDPFVDTTTPSR